MYSMERISLEALKEERGVNSEDYESTGMCFFYLAVLCCAVLCEEAASVAPSR